MLDPKKLGKYEIKEQIGRGGMGIVYRGYDPYTDRDVAVKVPIHEVSRGYKLTNLKVKDNYRKSFFNEVKIAASLKHPNILEILDAGIDNDCCYIVMEYIEDAYTLKKFCDPKNLLPVKTVIEIIFKCAKALDYAHNQGVIHRDIKPNNILLTKDKDIKIGDFSIAQLVNVDKTKNTIATGFIGSPRYMSPEQIQEDKVTNQTDIFSMGIVMYEILTGHHPFFSKSFSRLMHMIINVDYPPLANYRTDIPSLLEKIIYRVLQKDPEKRYKKSLYLASDLSLAFDYLAEPKKKVEVKERFNIVESIDFFNVFSEKEIWEIIYACIWQEFEKDTEVIIEGDIDDSFYIIISGEVNIYKDKVLIGNLKKGDCFGEMSYMGKVKRTATIITKSRVELMKINSTLIEQASTNCQLRFSKIFISTLIKRLSETTAMYASK